MCLLAQKKFLAETEKLKRALGETEKKLLESLEREEDLKAQNAETSSLLSEKVRGMKSLEFQLIPQNIRNENWNYCVRNQLRQSRH